LQVLYQGSETTQIPLPTAIEPLRRQCACFLDCICTGHRPRNDAHLGLHVVRMLETADRSRGTAATVRSWRATSCGSFPSEPRVPAEGWPLADHGPANAGKQSAPQP
jgi:hypothetical protein